MTRYVLMWLEGPLQSWGADSKFNRRETLPFPSKSAVFGIILASLGARGDQKSWLSQNVHGDFLVFAYTPEVAGQVTVPQLRDFQMVGSGYDIDDAWQREMVPKTSDRKMAVGGGTKMTYRYYLQDACFAVLVALDDAVAESVADALSNPVYTISLGRKCCAPSEFIYQGVFDTVDEGKKHAMALSRQKGKKLAFECLQGAFPDEGEVISVNDVPVAFGLHKQYTQRNVTVIGYGS
ncbi:MAG: type I-E CRISPR-associated protein Cas5/CasD [Oxalobacter sp.]